jgi:hypothetical protein
MNERVSTSFLYEQCDVPQGLSLSDWRTRRTLPPRRRTHVASGMFAALFGRFPAAEPTAADRTR